ncbi:MAG TPA: DNA/RNA nuclease SfsA, partial [Desulfosalsimonadaceae bacterium]|nr:DNA/RNA nuclease SfsA [Desulfosalsimonadaceae bacterium]
MDIRNGRIYWPRLLPGILRRRYKRFLADVELDSGTVVTAHCPNSGSMTGCSQPGRPVHLSYHNSPRRKLAYTWELIDMPQSLVGVNTLVPNRLVAAAIGAGLVPPLAGYD